MRQIYLTPKIYYNSKRSFCFFYYEGKRIRIYNGKCIGKNIYPNKRKSKSKVLKDLERLRKSLLHALKNNWLPSKPIIIKNKEINSNINSSEKYERSVFQERINLQIYENPNIGSKIVAKEIATIIRKKQKINQNCVLGLATGSSPIFVYKELIRIHKKNKLSFHNVITFNLDEYVPMNPTSINSYHYFMYENLFKHIDIKSENINLPKGNLKIDQIQNHCLNFEKKIEQNGGLDFQLLGIGRTGHIGFNEPGALQSSITRLTNIDYLTKFDASEDFQGINNVPSKAITMGIKTIMKAKKIILLAWGDTKRSIIKEAVEKPPSESVPASYLQKHNNTTFVLDIEASSTLNRISCPWFYTDITNYTPIRSTSKTISKWDDISVKKAAIWLSFKLEKPILFLSNEDYQENGMSKIFDRYKNAYNANIKVFNMLQHTITGWPGGKPNADDTKRPERASPAKKRCLIFSPHPDDDVISMGGTIERLVKQGHEIYIAYQTSGNIAVFDEDVLLQIEILKRTSKNIKSTINSKNLKININRILTDTNNMSNIIKKEIDNKKDVDSLIVQEIKSSIRQAEAIQACKFIGVNQKNISFLNMPFYKTGKAKKNEINVKDISVVTKLIKKIKPHQIFAAGDLADPHGTHRLCLNSIIKSIENLKKNSYMKNCFVWLYRGAWKEWKIHDIDMCVPLSSEQIIKKRKAVFKHQSQKDSPVFPGLDDREFWQRAEERNKNTADLYRKLGFAKYKAMEAFKRYKF